MPRFTMSKTDKTRPFWVKKEDYKIYRPRLNEDQRVWEYRTYKWWMGEFRCSCKRCGYDAYQTPRRKLDRAESKRVSRSWEKEY